MTLAVIVLTCNQLHLTEALMHDIYAQKDDLDVWVVDNGGSYKQHYNEAIINPNENLRWVKGNNLGLGYASAYKDYEGYVLLNDDIRLSPNYFNGLREAAQMPQVGLVASLYDDVFEHQKSKYRGPAVKYKKIDREDEVHFVDGTAFLITADCFKEVGYLDAKHFGNYGWGGDLDYNYRARCAGFKNIVTHRCYINHFHQGSAKFVEDDWSGKAGQEMETGMLAKYGEGWRQLIGY